MQTKVVLVKTYKVTKCRHLSIWSARTVQWATCCVTPTGTISPYPLHCSCSLKLWMLFEKYSWCAPATITAQIGPLQEYLDAYMFLHSGVLSTSECNRVQEAQWQHDGSEPDASACKACTLSQGWTIVWSSAVEIKMASSSLLQLAWPRHHATAWQPTNLWPKRQTGLCSTFPGGLSIAKM